MADVEIDTTRAAGGIARRAAALMIIDMLGDVAPAGSKAMLRETKRAARTIAGLRAAAAVLGITVIFVDDGIARRPEPGARATADRLFPADGDHCLGKPQYSAFHMTNLSILLERLGICRLVLAGVVTDTSVMFTAADAHSRDYALWVPADAVAGTTADRDRWALELMRRSMAAEIRATSDLSLAAWLAEDEVAA